MLYQDALNYHKADLARIKSERVPIEAGDVFGPVDWTQADANKFFFGWLISEKLASARDIDSARRRNDAALTLGKYPRTCCEYVGAFIDTHRVSVDYSGTITLRQPDTGLRRDLIITELVRNIRVMASELSLPFQREAINDAVNAWYQDARAARVLAIRNTLDGHAEFEWVELSRRCFECSDSSPSFVAAVLRKFLYQIKLKLHGREVSHHLMPVLLGPQGIGKSTFMHRLISPISELTREADFKMISDERNIMLWYSYVLILDEMAYADRSDIEIVKHVITASTLDRRPMRTNDVVSIRQRATLMGASNKTMAELIRDDTGMRRFVGVTYRYDADWTYLNDLDWLAAWRSVSIEDADPMAEFRDELAAMQADSRHVSPVEAWLTQLSPSTSTHAKSTTDPIAPKDLFKDYLLHFRDYNDGQRPKGYHAWEQELGRLIKAGPDVYQVEKHKTKAGNIWRWCSRLPVAEGKLAA